MSSNVKRQLFIGIDPGATGAICLLEPVEQKIAFCETTLLFPKLVEWLLRAKNEGNLRFATVEDVHSIPGAASKSSFNFGRNLEKLHNALAMAGIPTDLVRPKVWQKTIGLRPKIPKDKIKKEVAAIATRLYPSASLYGPRGGLLDGRSDALMIAHYCYLTHKIKD